MITEDQLEKLCLDWFKSIGYDYICGYDIAPMAIVQNEPITARLFYMIVY